MLTNRQLLKEIKKPGRIYMPVLAPNDVVYVSVDKSCLTRLLKDQPADEPAIWRFFGDDLNRGGDRWLDVQEWKGGKQWNATTTLSPPSIWWQRH